VLITGVFGALILNGCGSSSKVSTATTTVAPAPSTTATVTGPTTTPPTTTAASSGSTGAPLFTTGPVPAVTGATDLSKEPVVAAGASPAPTVLTGQDLVVGTGATAAATDMVNVQYVGALYSTGKVFDASWTDNGPASFPLSGVIPGFKDAIIGMKVGGRREIVIPPAFGYGAAGQPPSIPGNATLIFVIDLLGVTS
jgi:FKBP-type peptidyl-prolyl cis-trans isomerase